MSRSLLLALAVLIALLVIGRLDRPAAAVPVIAPAVVVRSPEPSPPPPEAPTRSASGGTPTIDLLARLEGRRRLGRASGVTYFDSLFAETDSVVRRWPELPGAPLVVAIPPGDSVRYDAGLAAVMRQAMAIWEAAGLGLHFALTTDTSGAQVVVRGIDQLQGERAGQTDLQWTREGAIHFAMITVARRSQTGRQIAGPELLAVAVHEIGHALGLAHSSNPDDVMFPVTRTARLSPRDRGTLTLLYELPLGTVREISP